MKSFLQNEYKNTYRVITGRLFIIAFSLGTTILQNSSTFLDSFPDKIIYKIFVIYSLFSLFYYLVIKLFPVQRTFIFFQLIVDVLFVTIFSSITGLPESIFNNLFFIIVIIGSIYLSFTQGLLLAIIASFALSSITYIAHEGIIRIFPNYIEYSEIISTPWQTLLAKMVTFTFGMFVVAMLSGYLANRARQENILVTEILANLSNGVLVVDRQNRISYINEEICELFRLSQKPLDYLGLSFSQFAKQANCKTIEILNEKKELFAEECEYQSNDKNLLLEIRAIPIYMKKNIFKAMIFIVMNRTLQKELREISLRAQRLAIVNDLAANIVHEIRNPIASISGAVQEVKNSSNLDESDKKLLNIVSRESNRLSDIVTNFLEYSRLQTNLNRKCNLNQLFQDLITMVRVNPNSNKIQFELIHNQELFCKGDYNQLQQVFLNIILNAVEMQGNKGKISIQCKLTEVALLNEQARVFFINVNKIIEVLVADEGPGIPADLKTKIFDPFFTTKAAGTGLGLSIVQKIVESHGGLIQVQSENNKGTTFKIYLHLFEEK